MLAEKAPASGLFSINRLRRWGTGGLRGKRWSPRKQARASALGERGNHTDCAVFPKNKNTRRKI